jgi:DNA-binding NtrC family response regulator
MSTVLVVDDLIVDRHLAGGLLERSSSLDVVYAGNGAEALEIIKRDPPDLVLTDLMMPEVDGFELVAAVVSQYPLIPVILMTGAGSEETAVRALQAGAASYVPKSELAELLLETVENVLEAAREERSECRLMDCMMSSQSVFVLNNDSTMIPPLINYVHRAIRAVGLVDEANGIRVCVALE